MHLSPGNDAVTLIDVQETAEAYVRVRKRLNLNAVIRTVRAAASLD